MGSTRLPGKVAMDICGQPMLARVVQRARAFAGVQEVVVATSTLPADQAVADIASDLGVSCVRGSEDDVLARYQLAAAKHGADAVVRITADCPLLDSVVSSRVIETFVTENPDYASNMVQRTYPRGLDTEIVSREALEIAHAEASEKFDREHVTLFVRRQPERFRQLHVHNDVDLSQHRWTVDAPEDLELVRRIYGVLGDKAFGLEDVLEILDVHPDWSDLNRHVEQKKVDLPEGLS